MTSFITQIARNRLRRSRLLALLLLLAATGHTFVSGSRIFQKNKSTVSPLVTDDLAKVPEIAFRETSQTPNPPLSSEARVKVVESMALVKSKIQHLNNKKTDAYMAALLAQRTDLAGMPIAMGNDCRLKPERREQFGAAVATLRQTQFGQFGGGSFGQFGCGGCGQIVNPAKEAEKFWKNYPEAIQNQNREPAKKGLRPEEHITPARIAALMQVLASDSEHMRRGLVNYLAGVPHIESTKALARLAIFSAEDGVRQPALEALKLRRAKDYNEVLLKGLRYPYPPVAGRTAEALVKLERTDWVPELIDFLEEPDPRAPVVKQVDRKKTWVVRELVRINHLRNCFLCHAPGNAGSDSLTAPLPIPGELLPFSGNYYGSAAPEIVVRFDVTYLRQDFSMMQPVAEDQCWGELQRFDFVVRSRTLSAQEAKTYSDAFTQPERGALSPYHRAALAALRELTGRDTAPTAAAWRELLGLKK